MLTIDCVGCSRTVSLHDCEEISGFAVCPSCRAVFTVAGVSVHDGLPLFRRPESLSVPSSFRVSPSGAELAEGAGYRDGPRKHDLVMSWPVEDFRLNRGVLWFLVVALWTLALLGALGARDGLKDPEPGLVITFAAFGGIPALVYTYQLIVALSNRTHLVIADGVVRIHHAPLPWSSGTVVQVAEIERLFCTLERRGRHRETEFFSINTRLRSGAVKPVISNLRHPVVAMAILKRVEEALDLPPGSAVSVARWWRHERGSSRAS